MKCKSNGFIVVGAPITINGYPYYGIDTEAWPAEVGPFSKTIAQRIDNSVADWEKVFLLDAESAVKYYAYCCSKEIPARLLYCEATAEGTFYEMKSDFVDLGKACFLGYDYAYLNGDYYSAVVNDIIYRNLDISNRWKPHLNEHGLFSSFETVNSFAKDRECTSILENKGSQNLVYELGKFSIFRIFQIGRDKGTGLLSHQKNN